MQWKTTCAPGSTFRAKFLANEIKVVVLNDDQLVIDSVIYQREVDSQPDSQQSLTSYLDGASYRSASRTHPISLDGEDTSWLGIRYIEQ